MNLVNRFKRLTLWNKLGVVGALASIIALVIYIFSLLGNINKGKLTPEEKQSLSPSIIVSFAPLLDEMPWGTPYKYPLYDYHLFIGKKNKDSVDVFDLTVEFFFENIITEVKGMPILDTGGDMVGNVTVLKRDGDKTTFIEETPIELPGANLMALTVRKMQINNKSVNTNRAVFSCERLPEGSVFSGTIVVDLTKKPTLIIKEDEIGRYTGRYSYRIKEKNFSEKISGAIRKPKIEMRLAEHHYLQGKEHAKQEEYKEAILEFNKAIKYNLGFYQGRVFFSRANAYGNSKNYDAAISDYTSCINLKPKHVEAYFGRGLAYAWKDQNDNAISDYSKAIELNNEYEEAYYNRATIHARVEDHNNAISDYKKVIELNPKKAIDINTKLAGVYNNRGNHHRKKSLYSEAISDYGKATSLNPDLPEPYINRAFVWKNLDELEKAVKDFKKACNLGIEKACIEYKELKTN